eukprot:3472958-Alexandrium_andersonii.AAC.1
MVVVFVVRHFSRSVAQTIDAFGGFLADLVSLHESCAMGRCVLENRAISTEKLICEPTTIVVGT